MLLLRRRMSKHLVVFGLGALTAGCIDEPPPAEHLFGQYELTRTIEPLLQYRTDVGFASQITIALQSEQVIVASDQIREAIVLQHRDHNAWFELYETGWTMQDSDVTKAVVGYELEETEPGRLVGRAGVSLQNEAGQIRTLLGFDVEGVRIAPK